MLTKKASHNRYKPLLAFTAELHAKKTEKEMMRERESIHDTYAVI